ncbi:MAG: HAMP domain-containing histidine kinase [Oscillospiraceae bacterium]|jgi:signal transduction histidine kinase|nr:HAMP domain-containing histidine kinase [Oscillospiraceae bacterium]
MAVKKITMRWLLNNFAVIVLIIILAVVAAGFSISNYHYNNVRQTLSSRADIVGAAVTQYAQDGALDFSSQVQGYVASFSQKARMELMTIDGEGKIGLTSSGFEPEDKRLDDYMEAISGGGRSGEYVGHLGGQRVMAFTLLTPIEGETSLSAIRLVTSLENVDRQIAAIITGMVLLGVCVLFLILFSSSYFISSIVNPVGQVGETARRIAGGDFGARLVKKNNDEIGELCDVINYMAEELGAAEKMKNDFISSVSHELRTPLTAIQGWSETILADGGEDKEMLGRGMGIIIGETTRLSDMVEELLDFSRMQSGRLKLIRTKTDAVAELSEAVMMYTERARRDGIALVFEDEDVTVTVNGDKNRLRQVFVNVIDNAVKYSDSGGKVTVTARVDGDSLVIAVADKGQGIKPEDLPKIKTKFYKANSTRRGSGIGLAVADEIVTRHDGALTIDSVYGAGTTVTITLPVFKGDDLAQIDTSGQG